MTFWSKVAPLSICVWIFSVFWLNRQSCASITPVCLWRAIMSFQLSRLASFTVYAIEGKLVFNQFAPHSPLCICIRLVLFLYFIYHQFYTHIDTHDERTSPLPFKLKGSSFSNSQNPYQILSIFSYETSSRFLRT